MHELGLVNYTVKQVTKIAEENNVKKIKSEASRCLGCGRSVVDTNKCLGCGMCTVQCKFDAIHLVRNMGDAYSKMVPAEDKFKAIGAYLPGRTVKILKKKIAGK